MLLNKNSIEEEIKNGNIKIENIDNTNIKNFFIEVSIASKIYTYIPTKIELDIIGRGKNKKKINIIKKDFIQMTQNNNFISLNARELDDSSNKIYQEDILIERDPNINNELYSFDIPEEGIVLLPGIIYLCETNEKISSEKYIQKFDSIYNLIKKGIQINISENYQEKSKLEVWQVEIKVTHPTLIKPNLNIGKILFFQKI